MLSSPFLDNTPPFGLPPERKSAHLRRCLMELRDHHYAHCAAYARLIDEWQGHQSGDDDLASYPFFPVTLFKEFELRSVGTTDLAVVESSSTTSANSSKIYTDKQSRKRQSRSANQILADFVGNERRPYLVFDVESTVRGSKGFSARGAAILSLAHLAKRFYFVMRQEGEGLVVDQDALRAALEEIDGEPFLAYGFTFILYQAHEQLAEAKLPQAHPDSRFLHSGGWKKLTDIAVDKQRFNHHVATPWSLPPTSVIDFYGTVEQIGMAYPDCAEGLKHVPYWADVLIRDADSLAPCAPGEPGLIQLLSCLPVAAPNHSVLTEDIGELVLTDNCRCGRRGSAFLFRGRAPKAELRGCSDVIRR